MVVNWIPGQMALFDPPMAAGVFTLFLVWQLRPTRDCGISPRRPSNEERLCQRALGMAGVTRRDLVSEAIAVSLMMIHGRIETPMY